jgi:hypothetical protein
MIKDTSGPAFPNTLRIDDEAFASLRGMTLRDYFAAKAMQGALSSPNCPFEFDEDGLALMAYQVADAFLKARKM